MQAGAAAASVVGAPMGAAGTQSRSEDEESTGMKDIKRTATQAFVGGGGVVPNRRSSSRSIKRKKFDDELVESSLAKSSSRVKGPPVIEPIRCSGIRAPPQPTHPWPSPTIHFLLSFSFLSLSFSFRPAHLTTTTTKIVDLTGQVKANKFSIMCDNVLPLSLFYRLAWQAMRQLHPEAIAAIQSKALFGQAEEALLAKIASSSQPKLEVFQELLSKHPSVFYPSRTPKSLLVHWQLLKQYYLLEDQSVQPFPKGDQVLNFSDAEQLVDDAKLKESRDEVLEHELMISDRHQKKEIRQLEQELPRWQVLVDSITGMNSPDFDNQTLAALRGRMVRYLMRSREITLGRATKDKQIDVDLSLEGPAWKISRKQGIIKLKNNGDFFIANEGRRPIYIDGRPVLSGNKWKLNNNSVVEIAGLRFVFLINQELISLIKAEAAKMNQQ
uniref:Microspherule protein 1 n=1 Tax=Oncorhynchus mykiss TaxID=8022 RepID=A0A8C7VAH7_ONCMY